jgi:hypothetical protein
MDTSASLSAEPDPTRSSSAHRRSFGRQGHSDQRKAADNEVDADQKADGPECRSRKSCNDQTGDGNIEDSRRDEPAPMS